MYYVVEIIILKLGLLTSKSDTYKLDELKNKYSIYLGTNMFVKE